MRIGIDATALHGRYGGVEYSLWNLLCALSAEEGAAPRHEYCVYIPHDGPPPARLANFGSNWHWTRLPFRGAQKLRRIVWQQGALPSYLQRDGCDLLHAPTYVAPLNAHVPVVLTVYDLIALAHPQFATALNRRHYGIMLPRSIAAAKRVLAPSQAVADEIHARFPHSVVRVVPLGLEPIFFQTPDEQALAAVRAYYNLPEKYLLFVGNFEPKKNLVNVRRAVESLPDAPVLVVVGGNRAWPECEQKSTPRLRIIGYVARRDLPSVYAGAAAFVFPSLAEGFGLPVLEALACGAPVVTSDRVPLPDLQNVAAICDPEQPASIAAALARVLGDPAEAARLSAAGREYAQPWTWRRAAHETLNVYEEVGQEIAAPETVPQKAITNA